MSNERDSGRYDAVTDSWVDSNVRIDFAWGNIPMQPNDDRESGLDPELDSHSIATTGYRGFPAHVVGAPYDDSIPNTTMPNLIGLNLSQVGDALTAAGLVGSQSNTAVGATSQNSGLVATQEVAEGTILNVGDTVAYQTYLYSSPINHSISGIRKQFDGSTLDYNMFFMFLQGQNHNLYNGSIVNITGSDVSEYNKNGWIVIDAVNDNAFNTGGTKVTIFWNGAISETANGSGGTYTKVS